MPPAPRQTTASVPPVIALPTMTEPSALTSRALLTALGLQLQMLQQLIPVVRFDGYYVLSDLAGVPDLFARVGPVLRSLRPGHPVDPRVSELPVIAFGGIAASLIFYG